MEGQLSISLFFLWVALSSMDMCMDRSMVRCLPAPPVPAPTLPQSLRPLMWTLAHAADNLYLLQCAWLGVMLSLLHPRTRKSMRCQLVTWPHTSLLHG